TNQNVSLFPNDANYVTATVTNGLPDANTLAGKAATNQNISLFVNDALFVTKTVTNGLLDSFSTNALLASATTNLFLTTNATVTASTGLLGGGKLSNTLSIDASLVVTSGANVSRLNNDSLFVTKSVTNGLLDSSSHEHKSDPQTSDR